MASPGGTFVCNTQHLYAFQTFPYATVWLYPQYNWLYHLKKITWCLKKKDRIDQYAKIMTTCLKKKDYCMSFIHFAFTYQLARNSNLNNFIHKVKMGRSVSSSRQCIYLTEIWPEDGTNCLTPNSKTGFLHFLYNL